MQYETVKQLPVTLRDVLPEQAKEIYRKAYNQAWAKYDQDAHGGLDQQGLAHQQAWMAVKREYGDGTLVCDTGQRYLRLWQSDC
jgi:cation transport regulator